VRTRVWDVVVHLAQDADETLCMLIDRTIQLALKLIAGWRGHVGQGFRTISITSQLVRDEVLKRGGPSIALGERPADLREEFAESGLGTHAAQHKDTCHSLFVRGCEQ